MVGDVEGRVAVLEQAALSWSIFKEALRAIVVQ